MESRRCAAGRDLFNAPTVTDPVFGFQVPTACTGVPADVLIPRKCWMDEKAYDATLLKLAEAFKKNFAKYSDAAIPDILAGGPQ